MQLEAMDEAVVAGQIVAVPEILKYPFSSLYSKRLVEIAEGSDFYLELRTDIVDFPKTNTHGADTSLLVYSLDFHAPGKPPNPRLITAFPVQTSFAAGIFDPSLLGEQKPLKLNYNAAVPVTIPAESMVGKRFIANDSCHRTRN
jgi:hypothetical protein